MGHRLGVPPKLILVRGECVRFDRYRIPGTSEARERDESRGAEDRGPKRGDRVVQHRAESARDVAIHRARGPRLRNVARAK